MYFRLPLVVTAAVALVGCSREDADLEPIAPLDDVPAAPMTRAGPEQPTPEVRSYPTGEIPEDRHLASGYQVYRNGCMSCHDSGATNAPVLSDVGAWRDRLAKGKDLLYEHAINGFTGERGFMPPKGGSPASWSDADVRAAVDYMAFVVARQQDQAEAKILE